MFQRPYPAVTAATSSGPPPLFGGFLSQLSTIYVVVGEACGECFGGALYQVVPRSGWLRR